jgi:hypothetical protein
MDIPKSQILPRRVAKKVYNFRKLSGLGAKNEDYFSLPFTACRLDFCLFI